MQTFKLTPYVAMNLPDIQITGTLERTENQLSIRYAVYGDLKNILVPELATPSRKHDLWRANCFEFFIAIKEQPNYWEFNMSPTGAWNVYAMDAYRQVNMREETRFTQLPFEFRKMNDEITLDISVDLNTILQPAQTLQLGITTIIQTKYGNESYWALAHPGAQADFHLRDSFLLEV